MVQRVLTGLVCAVFAIYSQSMLVMWCLYFLERHDIVLYFCPEELGSENPFAGATYVHQLCDHEQGIGKGALSLVRVVERSYAYVLAVVEPLVGSWPQKRVFFHWLEPSEREGYFLPLIDPPRAQRG